jgi:serine/threonine protein kinase
MSDPKADLPPQCQARYQVGELIASGGQGDLYLARSRMTGKQVVVKLLHSAHLANPNVLARFQSEAKMTASLLHPNIVEVVECCLEDEVPWIAYEYLAGRDLRKLMTAGPMSVEGAISVGVQVCAALEHAHEAGIIHRDIKPENILHTATGIYKVGDFGLARWAQGVRTQAGVILGTLAYMPPETALGLPVGPRSDLFSLSVVLFELLTGQLPRPVDKLLDMLAADGEEPVRPCKLRPGIPPQLDRVIVKGMDRNMEERFASAREMREALSTVTTDSSGVRTREVARNASRRTNTRMVAPAPVAPVTPVPPERLPAVPGSRFEIASMLALALIGAVLLLAWVHGCPVT